MAKTQMPIQPPPKITIRLQLASHETHRNEGTQQEPQGKDQLSRVVIEEHGGFHPLISKVNQKEGKTGKMAEEVLEEDSGDEGEQEGSGVVEVGGGEGEDDVEVGKGIE